MSDNYISVSQLNTYIKNIFEAEVMLQNICVYGEISSYNISNGIAYFNLKDENGLLSCVLFSAKSFDTPNIGDMVLVKGSMNYYAKAGKLSFNAYSISPYGKGLLYEKFLQLKSKLEGKGYFDPAKKKPIPPKVSRVGVVSSPTGAVIRDIIDVTHRRNDTIDIVLYPVKVQGVGADIEIAQGINFFSNYEDIDVIIVARGGGSIEDLEPFNSEVVADATFNALKPIVSAVGHETDFTIIDFVADLRAPTPSAAAELVAWDKGLEIEKIYKSIYSMKKIIENKIDLYSKDIDILTEKINNIFNVEFSHMLNSINNYVIKLDKFTNFVVAKENSIQKCELVLESFNPVKLSQMGYAKVVQNEKVISRRSDLNKNQEFTLSMIDGNIKGKIV